MAGLGPAIHDFHLSMTKPRRFSTVAANLRRETTEGGDHGYSRTAPWRYDPGRQRTIPDATIDAGADRRGSGFRHARRRRRAARPVDLRRARVSRRFVVRSGRGCGNHHTLHAALWSA